MSETPSELRYAESHEWLRVEGTKATVGITDYAQDALTDVVFVELPEVGRELKQGEVFGTVESVKSVSELYAPVDGKVVAVNDALAGTPEKINDSPYDEGWMLRLEVAKDVAVDHLLDAAAYGKLTEG